MLQTGGSHGKLQRFPIRFQRMEAVDQAGGERVPGPHPVNDVPNLVFPRNQEFLPVVQHRRPSVMVRRMALPQGHRNFFQIRKLLEHPVRKPPVVVRLHIPGFDVHIGRHAQRLLAVLLVGHDHIRMLDDLGHDLLRRPAVFPEILPVVQITGDGQALLLRLQNRLQRDEGRGLGNCRRDSGDVKPSAPRKNIIPRDLPADHLRDCGVCPVVNDDGRPLVGPGLQEIDPQPLTLPDDAGNIHPLPAELRDATVPDPVRGDQAHEGNVHSEMGQPHGYIRLSPAEGCLQRRALEKPFAARGLQSQHDFAEGNDFFHSLYPFFTRWIANPEISRSK